jgi:NADH-quinone oxidoreductase subunit E
MLSEYLEAGHDETTADGTITLEHAECLAACDYGPVMTVNYEYFDRVDVETALGVVTQLQSGKRPQPTRGARLCTLKEMSLQLAGFGDEREEAVADSALGEPTLRGNRLAEEHGISVPEFDRDTPIASKQDRDKSRADAQAAEAAGVAANKPASDRKPAGDAKTPQEIPLKEAKK